MSENPEITLPSDYTYYKLSYKTDDYNFRIKEVNDQDSAEKWLKAYSSLSKTDWRVQRTYSCSGLFVIFKKDYRCCHFTDRRVRGIHPSKHTGCQAQISILVSRFNEKSKKPNYLAKAYPCTIRIKNPHNHSTDYAEIFAANFKRSQKKKKPKKDIIYVTEGVVEDLGWVLPLPNNASEENSRCNDDVDFSSDIENGDMVVNEIAGDEAVTRCADQSDAITGIRAIFSRIEMGIQSNPSVFLPAAKKMLQNASKFGATETGLVTAMHTFAANSVVQRTLKANKSKMRRKNRKTTANPNNPRKSKKTVSPIKPRKCNKSTVNPINPRLPEVAYESYGRYGPACTERVNMQPALHHAQPPVQSYVQHVQSNVHHIQPAFASGNYSNPYVM